MGLPKAIATAHLPHRASQQDEAASGASSVMAHRISIIVQHACSCTCVQTADCGISLLML